MGMLKEGCVWIAIVICLATVLVSACGSAVMPLAVSTPAPSATPEPTRVPGLGDTQTRSSDGMGLVYVPAGQFEMGISDAQLDIALRVCNEVRDDCEREWFDDEQPAHTVALDAFWIDQTEVTNAQFAAFLNEQGNPIEEGIRWLEPGAGHSGIEYGPIEQVNGVFRPRTGLPLSRGGTRSASSRPFSLPRGLPPRTAPPHARAAPASSPPRPDSPPALPLL